MVGTFLLSLTDTHLHPGPQTLQPQEARGLCTGLQGAGLPVPTGYEDAHRSSTRPVHLQNAPPGSRLVSGKTPGVAGTRHLKNRCQEKRSIGSPHWQAQSGHGFGKAGTGGVSNGAISATSVSLRLPSWRPDDPQQSRASLFASSATPVGERVSLFQWDRG